MKRWIFAFLMIFACSNAAFALLPPYFQSVKEIEKILSDDKLHELLGSGQPIMEIQKMGKSYIIFTPKYSIKVNVIYQPQEMPGPAKFELQFDDPEELLIPHPMGLEVF